MILPASRIVPPVGLAGGEGRYQDFPDLLGIAGSLALCPGSNKGSDMLAADDVGLEPGLLVVSSDPQMDKLEGGARRVLQLVRRLLAQGMIPSLVSRS